MLSLILNFILKQFFFNDILINLLFIFDFGVIDTLSVLLVLVDHVILIDYLANAILSTCIGFDLLLLMDLFAYWHIFHIFLLQCHWKLVDVGINVLADH